MSQLQWTDEEGIPKNADGKNQASEVQVDAVQKTPVVQEGKHVQNEKAVDSIQIGQEEAMVQRTKTFRTERCCIRTKAMKMIFHGPLIPHGSKKLKRRKGVWQAMAVTTVKTLMRAIEGFP